MEFLYSGRTMVLPGLSDALADLAAAPARCAGAAQGGSVHQVLDNGISIKWADYGFTGQE